MSEPIEYDAADYVCKDSSWGEVKAVVIYSDKKKPHWWQWRKRRRWFKPLIFNVDQLDYSHVENGVFTITWEHGEEL